MPHVPTFSSFSGVDFNLGFRSRTACQMSARVALFPQAQLQLHSSIYHAENMRGDACYIFLALLHSQCTKSVHVSNSWMFNIFKNQGAQKIRHINDWFPNIFPSLQFCKYLFHHFLLSILLAPPPLQIERAAVPNPDRQRPDFSAQGVRPGDWSSAGSEKSGALQVANRPDNCNSSNKVTATFVH